MGRAFTGWKAEEPRRYSLDNTRWSEPGERTRDRSHFRTALKQIATRTINKRTDILSAPNVTTVFCTVWTTLFSALSTHKRSRVVLPGTIVLKSKDKDPFRPFNIFPSEGCSLKKKKKKEEKAKMLILTQVRVKLGVPHPTLPGYGKLSPWEK